MTDPTTYTFKIEDFSPESMPFARLLDYYLEIKKMLGIADHLHLVEVIEGSHGSAFKIDPSHESAIEKRLVDLNTGVAVAAAGRARDTINNMLCEDGTSGSFYDSKGNNVIPFPGKNTAQNTQVRVRGAASFVGELYHIAGSIDDAKVRVKTEKYGVVFCSTSREIAKSLRDFLFEDVKLSGRGMWTKTATGAWDIDDFVITDFAQVKRESLRHSVNVLRALDISWPEDTIGEIVQLEERIGLSH